jgi:hypothetical protein
LLERLFDRMFNHLLRPHALVVCIYIYMYMYMFIYIYILCVCACVCVCLCVYTHTHTLYTHTHTRARAHTHTHTHIHITFSLPLAYTMSTTPAVTSRIPRLCIRVNGSFNTYVAIMHEAITPTAPMGVTTDASA